MQRELILKVPAVWQQQSGPSWRLTTAKAEWKDIMFAARRAQAINVTAQMDGGVRTPD